MISIQFIINSIQHQATRGTGTWEAPGPCHAGTRDLCYLRRSYLIIIIITVSW